MPQRTIHWFGSIEWGAVCEEVPTCEAPVGERCILCQDTIAADDNGIVCITGEAVHRHCLLEAALGSDWRNVMAAAG